MYVGIGRIANINKKYITCGQITNQNYFIFFFLSLISTVLKLFLILILDNLIIHYRRHLDQYI